MLQGDWRIPDEGTLTPEPGKSQMMERDVHPFGKIVLRIAG